MLGCSTEDSCNCFYHDEKEIFVYAYPFLMNQTQDLGETCQLKQSQARLAKVKQKLVAKKGELIH